MLPERAVAEGCQHFGASPSTGQRLRSHSSRRVHYSPEGGPAKGRTTAAQGKAATLPRKPRVKSLHHLPSGRIMHGTARDKHMSLIGCQLYCNCGAAQTPEIPMNSPLCCMCQGSDMHSFPAFVVAAILGGFRGPHLIMRTLLLTYRI